MSSTPEIAIARPNDRRVDWQLYLPGIKVRALNSGVVQIATDDEEWRDA